MDQDYVDYTDTPRLDQYLARVVQGLSRSQYSKLIESGHVLVNGEPQIKARYKLKTGDIVKVSELEELEPRIPLDLPIIYEDNDCIVIDKPVGVLSHSKGAYNPESTVASWLLPKTEGLGDKRSGIVHRLDRLTSGVMIGAKNPDSLAWLQKQFSQRKTKKTYIAIVQGKLKNPEAIIDMPIERNPKRPQTFRVGANGKSAVTHYKTLETNGKYSLLELKPTTGRTHQLRIHLSHLGHPIYGDPLYGGKTAVRMFLHAKSLEITLPNKDRKTFTAEVPKEFDQVM